MARGIKQRLGEFRTALPAAFLLSALFTAHAQADDARSSEPADTGSSLSLDDDLFSAPGRDHDYTGGGALTLSGARATRYWFSLDPLLGKIDRRLHLDSAAKQQRTDTSHALAVGVIAFTPHDVAATEPISDDRPYASLAFLSNARRYVSNEREVAYNTNLVVGVLGLHAVGSAHRAIHDLTGSDPLKGYDHQISAGGEPTIRYSVARQALLGQASVRSDWKWTLAGSVGTVTESSLALNARWGRIRSPWWSYAPEQNMYLQETQPLTAAATSEAFFVAGARIRARAYNAFLQGQFRHSEVRYGADDLNVLLAETWAGVVIRRPSGFEIHYLARWGTPELRHGPNARSLLWGSVEFVRSFGGSGISP